MILDTLNSRNDASTSRQSQDFIWRSIHQTYGDDSNDSCLDLTTVFDARFILDD
jgi:hypothetical protein